MKASLRNSSVLALFLLAVVAAGQGTSQRAKAGGVAKPSASKAPAASTVKRPLRTRVGLDACPGTLITILPFNDTGDTTGAANDVNDVTCASALFHPSDIGPDLTYSFTILGPVNALTITVTPTLPYDPSIYVLSTCNDGTTCVAYADTFPGNPAETINLTNLAPGTYHLYIDSFLAATDPAGDGAYTLSVTGNLGTAPTPTATTTPTVTPTPTITPTPTPTSTGTVTPTPVFTATNTPTASPTVTSTPVPTSTLTPTPAGQGGPGAGPATPIPTLSGWMLAAFAAALVAVALFLTRRS